MKPTGPTNTELQELIVELRKTAAKEGVGLWTRLANDLESPSRNRRIVNLTRIDTHTSDNETIVVPGKVLAGGELTHKVNVSAWSFSAGAKEKILHNKGSCMSLKELVAKNPKGKNVRIIG